MKKKVKLFRDGKGKGRRLSPAAQFPLYFKGYSLDLDLSKQELNSSELVHPHLPDVCFSHLIELIL